MDEFTLIRRYFQQAFDRSLDQTGGADDCAALSLPVGAIQHLSIDTMVEGVHFYSDMPARAIGHRALATALSDLAAMGAKPWWCSLALTLPRFDEAWLAGFSQGFKQLAETHGIQLIGGDTTKGPLTISVQVAGLSGSRYLTRRGAQLGDLVCVTGTLGDAAGGLAQWRQPQADPYLAARYATPQPRCDIGQTLLPYANAAIDISDGLVADIGHITEASGVGIVIDTDKLPLSQALRDAFTREQASIFALSGGDDYELCVCIAPQALQALREAHGAALPLTVIGAVESSATAKVRVTSAGQPVVLKQQGFNHFQHN